MLFSLIGGRDFKSILIQFVRLLPILLFSLSLHETMHGLVALKLGDPTARNMGRLTLDPRKHIDPIGFLVLMVFGFGWAKPIPVNARYFKNPKWGMALTALAGPVSNVIMAFISLVSISLYGVRKPALWFIRSVIVIGVS